MSVSSSPAAAEPTSRETRQNIETAVHAQELAHGERFAFGENWRRFLEALDEDRIRQAERSVTELLGVSDLRGKSFLDVGCGSGLFSLAARRLGARVRSFDFDPACVGCAMELRRRYFADDPDWTIEEGSVLNSDFVESLGVYDVAYSWGVLHHTGAMWNAIDHVTKLVAPSGALAIAIYNDQGNWSRRWRSIKRTYCSGPVARALICATCIPAYVLRGLVADMIWRRNPLSRYREYRQNRGMSVMHDYIDWLGGYPFEFAKPEVVFDYVSSRGFEMVHLKTAGGTVGCNEFVFIRRERETPSPSGRLAVLPTQPPGR
jgi:2-polyprenyl-3-methyl-5-hydroxy-6-metoxy-1,4-benzoquinol methylase